MREWISVLAGIKLTDGCRWYEELISDDRAKYRNTTVSFDGQSDEEPEQSDSEAATAIIDGSRRALGSTEAVGMSPVTPEREEEEEEGLYN